MWLEDEIGFAEAARARALFKLCPPSSHLGTEVSSRCHTIVHNLPGWHCYQLCRLQPTHLLGFASSVGELLLRCRAVPEHADALSSSPSVVGIDLARSTVVIADQDHALIVNFTAAKGDTVRTYVPSLKDLVMVTGTLELIRVRARLFIVRRTL